MNKILLARMLPGTMLRRASKRLKVDSTLLVEGAELASLNTSSEETAMDPFLRNQSQQNKLYTVHLSSIENSTLQCTYTHAKLLTLELLNVGNSS